MLVFTNFGPFSFGLLVFLGGVFFFTIIVLLSKNLLSYTNDFSTTNFLVHGSKYNLSVILWQIFNNLLDLVSNLGALGVALKVLLT